MNSLHLPQRQHSHTLRSAAAQPHFQIPSFPRPSSSSSSGGGRNGACTTTARSLLQDLSPSPTTSPRHSNLDLLVSAPTSDPLQREIGWRNTFTEDFDVLSQIGAGAFGQVYLGQHRISGQQYAVKVMPKVRGKQSRASSVRALHREAQLQRLLQGCPGVAALVDCYEDANSVQLITELCRGGDLRQHVELHGALPEPSLCTVARELLLVLRSCHHQSILFADVKPANFCLSTPPHPSTPTAPGSLRAIDFGCSQRLGPSLRSSKRTGTLAFMAPETFNRDFGFKADVWGLGVTLYWLYAQRLPYWSVADTPRAPSLEDMIAVVQGGAMPMDYGPWLQLSAEGRDFVAGCLRRVEGERMGVEEALQHPWIKQLQG